MKVKQICGKRRGQIQEENMKYCLMLCLAVGFISSCDTEPNKDNSGGNGNGCADVSGPWEIVQHCSSNFVGYTVRVGQDGCDFSYTDPFPGWVGSIDADNNIISTGDEGGGTLTCEGSLVGSLMTLNCNPGECQVTLKKQ
jgi:hypothetical protein